ncbi:hypothetical protein BC940DRAFT_56380 [Gongronella butleri]|nr:hypothetical protein BC940DRAFT_56380 [Gongronella butleri]
MNIWGFVIQLLITVNHQQPSFALSMVDTIFACLEGFFVALVYFTDPAFTAFVHDRLSFWRSKYVDEYRLVELRAMDPKDGSQAHPKSRTLFIMPMEKPSNVPVWDSAIIHSDPKSRDSHHQESIHRECRPMRRIRIPPSTLAQLAVNYNIRQLSYCTLPSVTEEHLPQQPQSPQSPHRTHHHPPQQHPQDSIAATSISSTTQLTTPPEDIDDAEGNVVHEVFVPYRVAWWARMCHWLFSGYAMKYLCTSSIGTSSGPISSSTIELRSYSAHQPSPDSFDRDLLEDQTLAAKRRLQTALSETTRHY